MQQSLQILQAPAMELQQIIQQEVAVNPVLEVESPEVSIEQTASEDPDSDISNLSRLDEEWREYYARIARSPPLAHPTTRSGIAS